MPEGEFEFIARRLRPLATADAALGLADDAALLDPTPGRQLVLAKDAMVAGVHFLPDDPPAQIARKLLRVNLSDLAAMGAAPLGYLLALARSKAIADAWLGEFCAGLAADNAEFGIALLGGDTVATPDRSPCRSRRSARCPTAPRCCAAAPGPGTTSGSPGRLAMARSA